MVFAVRPGRSWANKRFAQLYAAQSRYKAMFRSCRRDRLGTGEKRAGSQAIGNQFVFSQNRDRLFWKDDLITDVTVRDAQGFHSKPQGAESRQPAKISSSKCSE
jgi:hypothetical protein